MVTTALLDGTVVNVATARTHNAVVSINIVVKLCDEFSVAGMAIAVRAHDALMVINLREVFRERHVVTRSGLYGHVSQDPL